MISTEKILFIVGGSFQRPHSDLENIVKERLKHKRGRIRSDGGFTVLGFGNEDDDSHKDSMGNFYKEANEEDFISFGLIPELVGRIPIRSYVNLLSKNDLIRIMRDTKDSIIHQYEAEFKAFNISLSIDDKSIEYVAELAENQKTGARALVSVWESILTDFQFELPGSNFKDLAVTEELCRTPQDALLKMLKRSPFLDYVEAFKREYGTELIIDAKVEEFVENYAKQNEMQISDALKKLLKGVSSLNYMNHKGKFKIIPKMLEDPKFFDNLFTRWYQKFHKEPTEDKN